MQGGCTGSFVRTAHVCITCKTERKYRVREKEHQLDMKSLEKVKSTHVRKNDSASELNTLAIMDHVTKNNHTIDLEE